MSARNPWQRARRAALLGCGVPALVFAGGALANPGMGSMSGGEDHHHATPKEKSGCSSCGGGSKNDPAARRDASQDAGNRAENAGDTGGGYTQSSGGVKPAAVSGADIAALGVAQDAADLAASKERQEHRERELEKIRAAEAAKNDDTLFGTGFTLKDDLGSQAAGKGILKGGIKLLDAIEADEAAAAARKARQAGPSPTFAQPDDGKVPGPAGVRFPPDVVNTAFIEGVGMRGVDAKPPPPPEPEIVPNPEPPEFTPAPETSPGPDPSQQQAVAGQMALDATKPTTGPSPAEQQAVAGQMALDAAKPPASDPGAGPSLQPSPASSPNPQPTTAPQAAASPAASTAPPANAPSSPAPPSDDKTIIDPYKSKHQQLQDLLNE
jgi:hypothetical protein